MSNNLIKGNANMPKLTKKTVISIFDDGTTTREFCTEGAQLVIVKSPDNDVKIFGHIPPNANKRGLIDIFTNPTQQNIANIMGINQSSVSRIQSDKSHPTKDKE